jgi:hypothetical protein
MVADDAALDVHLERRRGRRRGRGISSAAEDGADARAEFARAERLRHVVVAADFEADHAVDLVGARREKKHGQRVTRAQLPTDVEAIDVRQPDIEDDEIAWLGFDERERLAARAQALHLATFRLERVLDRIANGRLVLDDENARTCGHGGIVAVGAGGNQTTAGGAAARGLRRNFSDQSTRAEASMRMASVRIAPIVIVRPLIPSKKKL